MYYQPCKPVVWEIVNVLDRPYSQNKRWICESINIKYYEFNPSTPTKMYAMIILFIRQTL